PVVDHVQPCCFLQGNSPAPGVLPRPPLGRAHAPNAPPVRWLVYDAPPLPSLSDNALPCDTWWTPYLFPPVAMRRALLYIHILPQPWPAASLFTGAGQAPSHGVG